jgi:hypothetical protein
MIALRRAALTAVTVNCLLARSCPVKTNSRPPTVILCSPGESFRLSNRQSIPRLAANSVSTAARWRPARCTPPGASSSGKRPMTTGRVCQVLRPMASPDAAWCCKRQPDRWLSDEQSRGIVRRMLKVSEVARLGRLMIRRHRRDAGSVFLRLKSCFLQLHVSVNVRREIGSFREYHVFAGCQGKNRTGRAA